MAEVIGPGSEVVMHYRLSLADGTEVDSSFGGAPLAFTIGDGSVLSALEQMLFGMGPGSHECLLIDALNGYGFPDPQNIHDLPRADFPAESEPAPGLVIGFDLPNGESIPGTVLEVGEQSVRVDFNHPLAGHNLSFEIEILEVRNP